MQHHRISPQLHLPHHQCEHQYDGHHQIHRPLSSPLRPSRSAAQLRPRVNVHDAPPLPPRPSSPPPPYSVRRTRSSSALVAQPSPPAPSSPPSRLKAALAEAQFLAAGLVSRPAESTKHYTIIRHSHGLVWYKGPKTSIAITILADEPLPANRTLHLQEKGYSGNMGMSLKALMGPRDNWIDVTPVTESQANHIPEVEERAIQRDLKRFVGKATGRLRKHIPRETHLIRIPASATDGYFRLVLCCAGRSGDDDAAVVKRRILCGSPVFRIASTSTDISVVRGASLSTMPLEMGIKVASTVGTQVVKKYTGIAGAVVHSSAGQFAAKHAVKKAAVAVAHRKLETYTGGLQDAVQQSWRQNRQQQQSSQHGVVLHEASMPPAMIVEIVGADHGPEKPFPIEFDGRVSRRTAASMASALGLPTAMLERVPDHITTRLSGIFMAWASIDSHPPPSHHDDDDHDKEWSPAIVTIAPGPSDDTRPTIAMSNTVHVHIAREVDDDDPFPSGCHIKVLLMGYLRPAIALASTHTHDLRSQHARDLSVTLNSLSRETWSPYETVARIKAQKRARTLRDRLDDATGRVQQTVDRIPLHRAGVRCEAAVARDALIGKGGLWVRR
ncbi:hypothetical protein E4U55_001527 [Claviceps digitariae]|nr:hypothetical protein E4U55_001527 [Claviceps digitariae]